MNNNSTNKEKDLVQTGGLEQSLSENAMLAIDIIIARTLIISLLLALVNIFGSKFLCGAGGQ